MVLHDGTADFELIRLMANRESDGAMAREAWGWLYVRHKGFLEAAYKAKFGRWIGEEGVRDLVQRVFLKAYDRASTFNHELSCDQLLQRRKCRAWLGRIGENLFVDGYRSDDGVIFADSEEIQNIATPEHCAVAESQRLVLLGEGLETLTDIERQVLRATMLWWQPGRLHQRIPHSAMAELCSQTGHSATSIRQVRLRALAKLEAYVNGRLNEEAH